MFENIDQTPILNWLIKSDPSSSKNQRYRHQLIKEDYSKRAEELNNFLLLIFRKAHEDAIYNLRKSFEISLDPFADSTVDPAYGYPKLLPIETKMGYFGEVFAGIIAEYFSPLEMNDWQVPAYLFRFHTVAFQYLEYLQQGVERTPKLPGRTGNDCLAFKRDSNGIVTHTLFCEAKCVSSHVSTKMKEAYEQIGSSEIKPVDLLRVIQILEDKQDEISKDWLESLKVLYQTKGLKNYERCDLICYVCGNSPKEQGKDAWMPKDKADDNYTAKRKLEAVEIHLDDIKDLINTIYDNL